jgi:hypothetical protein
VLLVSIPSREGDVESLLEGSHGVLAPNVLDVGVRIQDIRSCDDTKVIDN